MKPLRFRSGLDAFKSGWAKSFLEANGTALGPATPPFTDRSPSAVSAEESGYLHSIDTEDLMELATTRKVFLEITLKPGDHVVQGTAIVQATPSRLSEEDERRVREAFVIGSARTPTQDIRYQFQQLTDVIVRALSPGINDPFTAINDIDELATGLTLLGAASSYCRTSKDGEGVPRLLTPRPQLTELLTSTVGYIAIYGASDSLMMDRLRRVLRSWNRHCKVLRNSAPYKHCEQSCSSGNKRIPAAESRSCPKRST